MSSSSGSSTSGKTSTPVVEGGIRPCVSVTGTRCTRCTPPSYFRCAHTPCDGSVAWDLIASCTSLYPPRSDSLRSNISVFQPLDAAYCTYIRSRSAANSALSALDLHNDIAPIVGIARNEQPSQPLLCVPHPFGQRGNLLRERVIFFRQLARSGKISLRLMPRAVCGSNLAQFRVAAVDFFCTDRIGVQCRVGEHVLQFGLLGQQHLHRFKHGMPRRVGRVG